MVDCLYLNDAHFLSVEIYVKLNRKEFSVLVNLTGEFLLTDYTGKCVRFPFRVALFIVLPTALSSFATKRNKSQGYTY